MFYVLWNFCVHNEIGACVCAIKTKLKSISPFASLGFDSVLLQYWIVLDLRKVLGHGCDHLCEYLSIWKQLFILPSSWLVTYIQDRYVWVHFMVVPSRTKGCSWQIPCYVWSDTCLCVSLSLLPLLIFLTWGCILQLTCVYNVVGGFPALIPPPLLPPKSYSLRVSQNCSAWVGQSQFVYRGGLCVMVDYW